MRGTRYIHAKSTFMRFTYRELQDINMKIHPNSLRAVLQGNKWDEHKIV